MISKVNSISQKELTTRHQILLRAFEKLDYDGSPWMYRLSENDDEIVIYITDFTREAFSVYSYKDQGFWVSLSATRVAGMLDGKFNQVFYEDISDIINTSSGIGLGDIEFWAPAEVKDNFIYMIRLVMDHINHVTEFE